MNTTILVPTDGTVSAENATEEAITLAKRLDADIHSIFVVSAPGAGFAPSRPDLSPLFTAGEEHVNRVRENVEQQGISCETDVFEADRPYEGILTYAEEHGMDYIVMGTHGEDAPFPGFFLGSVTERVLKASPIPVLVVPAPEAPDANGQRET